jgi:hypothetical protein
MDSHFHPIRVVHYGLGAIGTSIARLTAQQRGLQVVGGIERDPAKVGRDLGEVIGLDHPLGAPVSADANALLARTRPDIVILATAPFFHETYGQVLECVTAHANVLSTCEELVYPFQKHSVAAVKLHRLALQAGVTVLGAGVNPGFVMDLLPVLLTAPCVDIRHVSVTRVVDATERRASLQQRIGAGLTLDQFRDHLARGVVRHIGLPESIYLLADGLGWQLYEVRESADPIVANEWVRTPYLTVAPGQVRGIRQVARGFMHGREVAALTWQTSVGSINETQDLIRIVATPPVHVVIQGGLHGDEAASALLLHAIPRVLAAPPGLTTVLALPPIHYQPRLEPDMLLHH